MSVGDVGVYKEETFIVAMLVSCGRAVGRDWIMTRE